MSTDTNNTTTNQDINNETNNTPQLNNDELHYGPMSEEADAPALLIAMLFRNNS